MKRNGQVDIPQIKTIVFASQIANQKKPYLCLPKQRVSGYFVGQEQITNTQKSSHPLIENITQNLFKFNQDKKNPKLCGLVSQDRQKMLFSYKKLVLLDSIISMVLTLGFVLNFIRTQVEIKMNNQKLQVAILWVNFINSFVICFVIIFRHHCQLQILIDQNKIFNFLKQNNKDIMKTNFKTNLKQLFLKAQEINWILIIQIVLILIQPLPFLKSVLISLPQPFAQDYTMCQVNNILTLFTFVRIYIIIRTILNLTIYTSPRCKKLCQLNGFQHSIIYSIKTIINQQSQKCILFLFLLTLLLLGYGLRVVERTLPLDVDYGFQDYNNCLWCIFITMTTVGYGDYYPHTMLGRLVCVCAALVGIVIMSILIVSLTKYLQMESSQRKAHITLLRLNLREQLENNSKQAIVSTIKLFSLLKRSHTKKQLKQQIIKIKRKSQQLKLSQHNIKKLIDNYSLFQEMNRSFDVLKDTLKDALKQQIIIKNYFERLSKTSLKLCSIRVSFAKEVLKIMREISQNLHEEQQLLDIFSAKSIVMKKKKELSNIKRTEQQQIKSSKNLFIIQDISDQMN